ncbi:hypothetical protein [uncultured Marivita sp.]|uniref:hypothetical protein n=1 Tax=uncultured Marivita sp. TaxID=888080 RepID=UPI00261D17F9|nr:hypothetical protein [uncultured Marivita sp.]
MSEWFTADGTPSPSTSNLTPEAFFAEEPASRARYEVGGRGLEVKTPFDGGAARLVASQNTEYQAGEDLGYQGSIIGSAKTEGGSPIVNRKVTLQDRVTLPGGMTTNVAAAVQIGLLVRNADGSFSDVVQPETLKNPAEIARYGAPEGGPEAEPEAAEQAFDLGDAGREALSVLSETTMPGDQIRAMDEVLQLGGVSENTMARLASQAGMEPEQMGEIINTLHQAYYDAATDHLAAHGVTNEDAFEAFLGDNPRLAREVLDGARALVMTNDTNALTDVADAFLEQADRYMPQDVTAALNEVGLPYRMDGGRVFVNFDGQDVPWSIAVRQKLLKFL